MLTKIIRKITQVLLAIAAAVLSIMMLLTAVDVVMRYLVNRPISGAFELTEYMMAIFVPFSIAYCAEQKGHVSVEFLIKRFPKWIQESVDILTSLLTMLFAVFMAWQNILYIGETYTDKLTSAVLLIPVFPFIAPVAIGIGVYALVTMLHMLKPAREAK
jgi:TRAP-type C4-dicarboxylate transport system permease small subunit